MKTAISVIFPDLLHGHTASGIVGSHLKDFGLDYDCGASVFFQFSLVFPGSLAFFCNPKTCCLD